MKEGLEKVLELIETELVYARTVNTQMAMGMLRIKELVEKELKEAK